MGSDAAARKKREKELFILYEKENRIKFLLFKMIGSDIVKILVE